MSPLKCCNKNNNQVKGHMQFWNVPFIIGQNIVLVSYILINCCQIKETRTYVCITVHLNENIIRIFKVFLMEEISFFIF